MDDDRVAMPGPVDGEVDGHALVPPAGAAGRPPPPEQAPTESESTRRAEPAPDVRRAAYVRASAVPSPRG